MAKVAYYPGCALEGSGGPYDRSTRALVKKLGLEMTNLADWNCCGATAYMSVDEAEAGVLAARNLAMAENAGPHDLITPCSACYLVLNKTKHNIEEFPDIRNRVHRALERHPRGQHHAQHAQQRIDENHC